MNKRPENLYVPERLEGEGIKTYHHRQKISRLAARMGTVIRDYTASPARLARRKLVKEVGIRQARKVIRKIREAYKAAAAEHVARVQAEHMAQVEQTSKDTVLASEALAVSGGQGA